MKFLFQPTLATPGEWEEFDSGDWRGLAKKPRPTGRETIDDVRGWCHAINVQGVIFQADSYHVESIRGGVRVTVINDDTVDHPAGSRFARVWDILTLAEDSAFGNAFNTRQSQVVYHEASADVGQGSPKKNTTFEPWANFTPPPDAALMHGKQTTNELNQEHRNKRGLKGWRDRAFTEGVPAERLDLEGNLKQNKPDQRYKPNTGTRVYNASNAALANGIHVATHEFEASIFPSGVPALVTSTLGAGTQGLAFSFVTPSNEPNDAAWPTGNYRMQLDITTLGANSECGLTDINGALGHFARVNAAVSSDLESFEQVESAFTGTGLNLATTGSVSPSAGAATDRLECLIAQQNAGGGDEDLILELNEADDFIDGPWPGRVFTPSPVVATWAVLSPRVALGVTFTPSPVVATWAVAGPANVFLGRTLIPMPAVARWSVLSPSAFASPLGIGDDRIVADVIEKTVVMPQ